MKSIITLFTVCAVASILFVAGCSSTATTSMIASTLTATSTSTSTQQGDDIMITPGGYAYRANINQQGQTNPFTPIQTADIVLSGGHVTYRADIQTVPGTIRNNIVDVYGVLSSQSTQSTLQLAVTLSVNSFPAGSGITVNIGDQGSRPGNTETVLNIVISPQTAAGDYQFNIGIVVDGLNWGTVPCTLHVTA
jgi:hypothetical protein